MRLSLQSSSFAASSNEAVPSFQFPTLASCEPRKNARLNLFGKTANDGLECLNGLIWAIFNHELSRADEQSLLLG